MWERKLVYNEKETDKTETRDIARLSPSKDMKIQIFLFSALVAACYGTATTIPDRMDGGGFSKRDPNDPLYTTLAWNPATAAVNKQLKEENPAATSALVPIKVLAAQRQLVAGFNDELDIEMAESKCKIGANTTYSAENCPLTGKGAKHVYRVRIYSVKWLNTVEVTSVEKIK